MASFQNSTQVLHIRYQKTTKACLGAEYACYHKISTQNSNIKIDFCILPPNHNVCFNFFTLNLLQKSCFYLRKNGL